MTQRGLVMVNTGDGKGKTTAAMSQAVRAVGAGLKVLMIQFLKVRARFPVPPGFCVTVHAYRNHMAENGLDPASSDFFKPANVHGWTLRLPY